MKNIKSLIILILLIISLGCINLEKPKISNKKNIIINDKYLLGYYFVDNQIIYDIKNLFYSPWEYKPLKVSKNIKDEYTFSLIIKRLIPSENYKCFIDKKVIFGNINDNFQKTEIKDDISTIYDNIKLNSKLAKIIFFINCEINYNSKNFIILVKKDLIDKIYGNLLNNVNELINLDYPNGIGPLKFRIVYYPNKYDQIYSPLPSKVIPSKKKITLIGEYKIEINNENLKINLSKELKNIPDLIVKKYCEGEKKFSNLKVNIKKMLLEYNCYYLTQDGCDNTNLKTNNNKFIKIYKYSFDFSMNNKNYCILLFNVNIKYNISANILELTLYK